MSTPESVMKLSGTETLEPAVGRVAPHSAHAGDQPGRNYLNADYNPWSWLFTTDHKRVGILYLISITLFFFLGGAAADEDRLAQPFHRQLGAHVHARDVDIDRRQRLHVGRRVHLVHERPDGGADGNRAGPRRGVIEEVAAGACGFFCVGHESSPLRGRAEGGL